MSLRSVLLGLIITLVYACHGNAQQGFKCPPAGTRWTLSTGIHFGIRGTDPADPFTCLQRNGNRRLFNFYITNKWPAETDGPPREALRRLFSGETDHVSFETWFSVPGYPPVSVKNVWTRLDEGTLSVAGRPVRTVPFQVSFFNGAYSARWKVWFDPATSIFVKMEVLYHGPTDYPPRDWEVTSIKLPAKR